MMKSSTVDFKNPGADLHRKSPRIFVLSICFSVLLTGIGIHLPIFRESTAPREIETPPVIIQLQNIPETRQIVRAPAPRLSVPLEIEDNFMPDDITIESTELDLDAAAPPPAPPPAVLVPDTGSTVEEEEVFEYFAVEEPPERKNTIIPDYPEIATRSNLTGIVYLKALVNKQGLVDSVEVVKGPNIFHQSSIDAAIKTEFTPAKHNDRPVTCWVIMSFRFVLEE